MYYHSFTMTTRPGVRFQGIEHLKKLASWMKEKYGIETQVLGNVGGVVYQNHIVSRFDTMAQLEENTGKLLQDAEYQQWFESGKELFNWQETVQRIYQVF